MIAVNGTWRFHVRQGVYSRGFDVFPYIKHADGSILVITSFEMMALPDGARAPDEPPVYDGEGFLRAALNAAWEAGLRPDGFNDTREGMAATKAHLADMRAIAFHKIGAEKP